MEAMRGSEWQSDVLDSTSTTPHATTSRIEYLFRGSIIYFKVLDSSSTTRGSKTKREQVFKIEDSYPASGE